jgi:hypothetical protein
VTPHQIALVQRWQDEAGGNTRLNLVRATEIRDRPKPEMLINEVLPPGGLFQIFGQTGSYKSFIVVSMAGAIANGTEWMGHKVNQEGDVAIILGEGAHDAGNRIDAWAQAHPVCSIDRIFYSVEEGIDLMDPDEVSLIIDDLTADPDKEWRLIIFDTQADHMPNGDEDKAKDFSKIKKSLQRIAHTTGAAVGLVHHTGWDDSRERGSSRQRQALDMVMQVKDQRITNVKQKFGPKFEPIMFAIEPVAEAGSVYVRLSTEAEQLKLAFESVSTVSSDVNAVKALAIMLSNPGISGNKIVAQLHIQKSSWPQLRAFLEMKHYVACERNDNGHVVRMSVTDKGAEWLASKQAEGS